ncbi:glycosyltransferase [Methylobacter sp.]|uniref:glycosyltransferase n=1 Tax=Methylobacter sp. TaxID=2051955 RepID=UPI002FDCA269
MKLFVTVGSMLPFDRLICAMDTWTKEHPEAQVYAQIGGSSLRPANMEYCAMISPSDYRDHIAACDVVVSHVGIGTIIAAMEYNKPLVMMPRRPELREVTSKHQLSTAKWLEGRSGICIINSDVELAEAISNSIGSDGGSVIETGTRGKLINTLRQFISN